MMPLAEGLRLAADLAADGSHESARVIALAAVLDADVPRDDFPGLLAPMMAAVTPAITERIRQIRACGYDAEHDDQEHCDGQLGTAAASLLLSPSVADLGVLGMLHDAGPTLCDLLVANTFEVSRKYSNPTTFPEDDPAHNALANRLRDIDVGIALAMAERERLMRAGRMV